MRTFAIVIGAALVALSTACGAAPPSPDAESIDESVVAGCAVSETPFAPGSPEAKLATLLAATAEHHDFAVATLDGLELAAGPCAARSSLMRANGRARSSLTRKLVSRLRLESVGDALEIGKTVDGDAAFGQMIDRVFAHLEELVADGQLDFGDTPELAGLWSERATLRAALDGAGKGAAAFVEIPLATHLDECSEQAVARIDLRDRRVLVLRRTPRC